MNTPMTTIPTPHDTIAPDCRRSVSATIPDRRADARGRPSRSASRPVPRSRRPTSQNATATRTAATTTPMASGQNRSSTYARVACAHPNGDSHVSTLVLSGPRTSPTARSRNATPSTAMPSELAARACAVSCEATAEMPANTSPTMTMPPVSASEPTGSSPVAQEREERQAADDDRRDDGGDEPGDDGRVATHGCGPHELEPAVLLGRPQVPRHGQQRHDRDRDHDPEAQLVGRHRADRVVVEPVAGTGQGGRRGRRDELRAPGQRLGRGVDLRQPR